MTQLPTEPQKMFAHVHVLQDGDWRIEDADYKPAPDEQIFMCVHLMGTHGLHEIDPDQ